MQNSDAVLIKDSDMSTFVADVIEKSMTVPVLVYFHSAWSENCKQMTPVLEKLIVQAAGAVHMTRIDFEQNKQLAGQMKIQSVPTVVIFSEQRPVDAFSGVKSEAEVKEFIARFAPDMQPSPTEQMTEQAAALFDAAEFEPAAAAYAQILQVEPENPQLIAGFAQSMIKLGDMDNARKIMATTPKIHENDADILAARAALDMAEQLDSLGDAKALEAALAKNPDDHQARFDLALVRWAEGAREAAADHLLEIVRRDRQWSKDGDGDGARKQLLKFFEIAGLMDPFTVSVRKKLSSLLFS